MATALHINTIHDIISAVEQSDSSHGIFTSNSTMRKRARYLVSEAHTLLSMLRFRGEMSRDAKAEYEYVYSRYQSAAYNTNARSQLEAAQDLWSFALTQARNTSHDLITQSNPAPRVHWPNDLPRAAPHAPARDIRPQQPVNRAPVVPPRINFNLEPPHERDTRPREGYYVPPRIRFPMPAPPATGAQHQYPPPPPAPQQGASAAWPSPPPTFGHMPMPMPMPMAMPVLTMMPAAPAAIPGGWAAPPPLRR